MLTSLKRYTFRKPEKICSQKQIDQIFSTGKSFTSGQFRLIYIKTEISRPIPVQVLIAVPKRNLKHAVDRNRMKRLIREAYRLSKHKLTEVLAAAAKHYDIAIVFNGNRCVSQSETMAAINVLLDRLLLIHEKNSE